MPGDVAITRAVSPGLAACELTYQERVPIDIELARAQHRAYEQTLSAAGYGVQQLASDAAMPDARFDSPPDTVATSPDAEPRLPPATVAREPPAVPLAPPATPLRR